MGVDATVTAASAYYQRASRLLIGKEGAEHYSHESHRVTTSSVQSLPFSGLAGRGKGEEARASTKQASALCFLLLFAAFYIFIIWQAWEVFCFVPCFSSLPLLLSFCDGSDACRFGEGAADWLGWLGWLAGWLGCSE